MGGVSPETCWASYKHEITFWYTVASCWIFFVNYGIITQYTKDQLQLAATHMQTTFWPYSPKAPGYGRKNKVKSNIQETGVGRVEWIHRARDRDQTGCCEHGDEPSHSINGVEFLSNVCDCFSRTLSPYSRLAASYSQESQHVSPMQLICFTKYSAY